ncbi:hypothetical protein ELQ35_17800 [Peribacillus cavernae]|uniref:Yip1 domain-containing protein n=1 Tax=Peribacillus cavernae TaxID=1674310 RepID=A0A433HF92_9BACI|nr:hypothetical protein [Peribacillus cavernae]MDQ0221285.1 hypothetical protein [Peribacillus cavernae]RUQ26987.1 hypothetical protein ELQ35_17800 [Peribacillus cavernae]
MIYRVQLLNGTFRPSASRYRLKQAEEVVRFGPKLLLLYLLSLVIFGISAYLGIGSESISKEVAGLNASEFESKRLLVFAGKLLSGILFPSIFLFMSSLLFWIFTDIEYRRIVIVQMFVFVVALFEKAVAIPFLVLMDLDQDSNPFSFGVISQHYISNDFFIHFFGAITIFQLVIICLQYYYLRYLADTNRFLILLAIGLFYIVSWFAQAFLSYIKVSVFF